MEVRGASAAVTRQPESVSVRGVVAGRIEPRRRNEAEENQRNQRTVELLSRTRDGSLSEAERQRRIQLAVELNLPIAESLARRYHSRGEDLDDLIQVARLGLIQAAKRYRPEVGPFLAFAVPTIAGEIKRHFRDRFWSTPRPPRRLQDLRQDANEAWAAMAQEKGHSPNSAELADRLGANQHEIHEAMAASPVNSASLDAPATGAPASDWIGTLDPGYEAVDDAMERAQLVKQLRMAISELSETDRLIVHLRFGQNCKQSAIAAELGISQMSVSRRLARIIRVLHRKLLAFDCNVNQVPTESR